MTLKGSVAQKGGKGTTYEQKVQAAFIATLAMGGIAPTLPNNHVLEVALQVTRLGYHTNDLMVIAASAGKTHRLLAEIKMTIHIGDNKLFNKVIADFWDDFNNTDRFNASTDRLLLIKSHLEQWEKEHLKVILDWARTHATAQDFFSEVNRVKVKKEKLSILSAALEKANGQQILTEDQLWKFLKCFHILPYDLVDLDGLSTTHILNQIRLSRSAHSSITEVEIWNCICQYAAEWDGNGGNITQETIAEAEFFKHFNPEKISPCYGSIKKLASHSQLALGTISNTIGHVHLPRTEQEIPVTNALISNQLTVVTGKAGVGKSAVIKSVLKNHQDHSIFFFKADEFNVSSIAHILSTYGVHESIEDIFSCLSLLPEKIIFIDSLEKLLEADTTVSFQQLINLLETYPDLKLIASARQYALYPVLEKYQIDLKKVEVVEILPLQVYEIEDLARQLPQLERTVQNHRSNTIIEIPKYLDLIRLASERTSEDLSDLSLKKCKSILWNHLIKNYDKTGHGLPARREDTFMKVAVERAKKMKLFVKTEAVDEEAVELLIADEIIVQNGEKRRYAPSHDLLEDWALVRYVEDKHEDCDTPTSLFTQLGNEPAIRRAFRLWVEEELAADHSSLIQLVRETLQSTAIEKYWRDELLVAIFKSDHSLVFFQNLADELLELNGDLLLDCIQLIRTACKKLILLDNEPHLIPFGSGWKEVLAFINGHKESLPLIRLDTLGLLIDWNNKLILDQTLGSYEAEQGKSIVLYFIDQMRAKDPIWFAYANKSDRSKLVHIAFNLSQIARNEVGNLLKYAIEEKTSRSLGTFGSFADQIIEMALSGIYTKRLVEELPDLLIEIAWKEWKNDTKHTTEVEMNGISIPNQPINSICWGFKDSDDKFLPSGVYKTFVFNLLVYHPIKGLDFVTELLNYCVECYATSGCDRKQDLRQLEIDLLNGSQRTYWGSWQLWGAYRGITRTHYLMECILMSLEKYLLAMAQYETDAHRENLNYVVSYLMEKSNNVCTASVVASVAMAYPASISGAVLPIFGVKEFYEWDLNRSTGELSTFATEDMQIPFAQEARRASNHLPHRIKYRGGLRDFVFDYQLNIGTLNQDLFKVFDMLKEQNDNSDFLWSKTLADIDFRNRKLGEFDERLGVYPITPDYEEHMALGIEQINFSLKEEIVVLNYSNVLERAYEKKEEIAIRTWREIFEQYSKESATDPFFARPITLAFVGLRDLKVRLRIEEMHWCIETLIDSIGILVETPTLYITSVNVLEKEIAPKSFHLLLGSADSNMQRNQVIKLLIRLLTVPIKDFDIVQHSVYLRTTFYQYHPNALNQVWKATIQYSTFRKKNSFTYTQRYSPEYLAIKEKEKALFTKWANNEDLDFDENKLSFDTFTSEYLVKALLIIPPKSTNESHYRFIDAFLTLLVEDLKKEPYSSNNENVRNLSHQELSHVRQYLAEFLLKFDISKSEKLFARLVHPIYKMDVKTLLSPDTDVYDFTESLLKSLIEKTDLIVYNTENQDLIESTKANFWKLWFVLFGIAKENHLPYHADLMLLGIKWNEDSKDWKVFKGYEDQYYKIMEHFGDVGIQGVLDVFSSSGQTTFLPHGLHKLVSVMGDELDGITIKALTSESANRLIDRLYGNHMLIIKKNKSLLNDFMYFLDRMVDTGSSKAFAIRELVITYKVV